MKLVHALGEDLDPADASLREELAAAGVRRLQLNVDDVDSAALRLHTGDPIRAVVTTWTDGDPAAVTAILTGRSGRVAGWQVDERVPTPPPEVPDGERADALANLAFIRRPAGLDHAAWLAHWHGPHTTVAIETQATFGYVQNVVVEPVTPHAPPVDGIVEELFPSAAVHDVHAFYGSGGDDAELTRRITRLMESVAVLGADHDLDLVPTGRYVWRL
jgi:hypothetical protein